MTAIAANATVTLTMNYSDVLTVTGNGSYLFTGANGQGSGLGSLTGYQRLGPYAQGDTVAITAGANAMDYSVGFKDSSNETRSAVVAQTLMQLAVVPSTPSAAVFIGGFGTINYAGTAAFPVPGHAVGLFGSFRNYSAVAIGLGIGVEGTIENRNASGALTLACGSVSTLNANVGTITEFVGSLAQTTLNTGTITKGAGFSARLTGNSGTITEWNHYHSLAASLTGVTKLRFIKNEDPQAPASFAGPVCDSSFAISAPTNGSTIVLNSANSSAGYPVSTYVLNPAGTIAGATVTLPTAAMTNGLDDGQELLIYTTQTITTLSFTAGPVLYGAPSTLLANTFFKLKYFSSLAGWLRVG